MQAYARKLAKNDSDEDADPQQTLGSTRSDTFVLIKSRLSLGVQTAPELMVRQSY